jgi:hypothetical protein
MRSRIERVAELYESVAQLRESAGREERRT